MTTAFDTPVAPFTGAFADLPSQWIEASTRALTASAELYTQTLQLQADAARNLIETYAGLGGQVVRTGAETTERAEEATAQVARETGRATQRATRRTATATRRAVKRAKPAAKAVTPAATVEPPIAGYDDLTAEDLVAKLPEQSQATLVQVAAYEQAHDKRTTVLERVAALTGAEPAPGYDELNADEVQKLLTAGDAALATAVRDYERRHKSRASVLEAAARNADAS
jgi:gas vesicle protein